MVTREELIQKAAGARQRAYCPYSHYQVGAALLTDDGQVYTGCNIENASYSATVCAERTAIFAAVAAGHRHFQAMAVVGGPEGQKYDYAPPCGVCRQVMSEFCGKDFRILLAAEGKETREYTLEELLPQAFVLAER